MLNPSLLADIHLLPEGVGVNSTVANATSLALVMYSPRVARGARGKRGGIDLDALDNASWVRAVRHAQPQIQTTMLFGFRPAFVRLLLAPRWKCPYYTSETLRQAWKRCGCYLKPRPISETKTLGQFIWSYATLFRVSRMLYRSFN